MQQKLQSTQELHDRRLNLRGLSEAKFWGLASLREPSIVAACISVHAGDAPENKLRSQDNSILVFASENEQDTWPWQKEVEVCEASQVQKGILEATSTYWHVSDLTQSSFSNRIFGAATAAKRFLNAGGDGVASDANEDATEEPIW